MISKRINYVNYDLSRKKINMNKYEAVIIMEMTTMLWRHRRHGSRDEGSMEASQVNTETWLFLKNHGV